MQIKSLSPIPKSPCSGQPWGYGSTPRRGISTGRPFIYLFIYYYIFKEQVSFSLKNFLFIYFCLHWVFVAVLSLVAASKNCSPAVTHSLLIAVASLVEEHRL